MKRGQVPEPVVCALRATEAIYPKEAPFHPGRDVPEYDFETKVVAENPVYEAVRSLFHTMGLDQKHYGTTRWNPLQGLILPGETVLLKPNLVKEYHPRDLDGWRYVITHGSVIRAVADYVWKALEGRGTVIVADAPQTDSSFAAIRRLLGLDELEEFYQAFGLDFRVIDLRKEEWISRDGVVGRRTGLAGDPYGYVAFDIGNASEFYGHEGGGQYYGADYDEGELNRHHTGGRHEYLIAGTAIHADVVFSLPKLKTHKKAGITVSLKNLVGINGDKNWLPHHTEPGANHPGDERPPGNVRQRWERSMVRHFRQLSLSLPVIGPWLHYQARQLGRHAFGDTEEVIRSGNWWGNDTVWRMCLDLNKILLYGKPDGTLREALPTNRKRHYALVDGIIAGEGRGPMNPDPVAAGLVVFGLHPASVDAACAYLMGFDPERIPIVRQAFRCRDYPLAEWDWPDVRLISDWPEWNGALIDIPDAATFCFEPHFGWKGAIERRPLPARGHNGSTRDALSETADRATARRL